MVNATSGELVRALSRRGTYITPSSLRSLYKTEAYEPAAMDQNALGILGFGNQYPSQKDLMLFMTNYREDAVTATYTVEQVNNGGYDQSHPRNEANMNIQYAEAMSYPTQQIFYSTGGDMDWSNDDKKPASDDSYLKWLQYILKKSTIPQTISISYSNPEPQFPPEYLSPLCRLFAVLAVRGVSVLVSTGNNGVGRGDCHDSSKNVRFIASFPASCTFIPPRTVTSTGSRSPDRHLFAGPFVTSVGGTMRHEPEVAVPFSGGGFSLYFKRPMYQNSAVSTFLNHLAKEYAGLYKCVRCRDLTGPMHTLYLCSPMSRGIPDIAAQANDFEVVLNAKTYAMSGVSCSAPVRLFLLRVPAPNVLRRSSSSTQLMANVQTVAGIVSLLNDYLLSTGRAPLGFLNPWLYDKGLSGLNDIISGSNPGCNTDGFSAIPGWDPVRTPRHFLVISTLIGLGLRT
jgi:tripeptidyl-peptidase-1